MKESEGYKELKAFQLAYKLSMEIFCISKSFPKEEKRVYPKHFSSKMTDADGECTETMIWLDDAKDCDYISNQVHEGLYKQYKEIGKMLGSMAANPEKFLPH